jgi:hypothetical protein
LRRKCASPPRERSTLTPADDPSRPTSPQGLLDRRLACVHDVLGVVDVPADPPERCERDVVPAAACADAGAAVTCAAAPAFLRGAPPLERCARPGGPAHRPRAPPRDPDPTARRRPRKSGVPSPAKARRVLSALQRSLRASKSLLRDRHLRLHGVALLAPPRVEAIDGPEFSLHRLHMRDRLPILALGLRHRPAAHAWRQSSANGSGLRPAGRRQELRAAV